MTAAKYAKNVVYEIPVGDVIDDRYQPRINVDSAKLKELADSIHKTGLHEPVLFKIEDDQVVLVAGHRRFKAVKDILKQSTVRAILAEGDPLEIALIENVVRVDLTPIEESKAYKALIETGKYKQKDIAEFTGKGESTISETLSIVEKIKPTVMEVIEKENPTCSRWVLMEIAKLDQKKQLAAYKKLNQKGLTRGEFKKGVTKTPANMPVYMAAQTAKQLGAFDYSNLSEEQRKAFIKNLSALRDVSISILRRLGVSEESGMQTEGAME